MSRKINFAEFIRNYTPTLESALDSVVVDVGDLEISQWTDDTPPNQVSEKLAVGLRALGWSLLKSGRWQVACKVYLLLTLSPCRSRLDVYCLGHSLGYRGLWQISNSLPAIVNVMRLQTDLAPDDFDAWMNLVDNWLDAPASMFDATEVERAIEQALRLRPDAADAHYANGMIQQHSGNLQQAARAYEKALAEEPGFPSAKFRLWQLSQAGGGEAAPEFLPSEAANAAEIDVPGDDMAAARAVFDKYGAVKIRGLIPTGTFIDVMAAVNAWMEVESNTLEHGQFHFNGAPKELQDALRALLDIGPVQQALGSWGGKDWPAIVHANWYLQKREITGDNPTGLHSDFPVSGNHADWFTQWMPFVACGPEIAPSLDVAATVLKYPLILSEQHDYYLNTVPLEEITRYFRDFLVQPSCEPGDLIFLKKSTYHGTSTVGDYRNTRMSFDSRMQLGPTPRGFPEF
jgi:tetratricopeptide (TPR) repeat protein